MGYDPRKNTQILQILLNKFLQARLVNKGFEIYDISSQDKIDKRISSVNIPENPSLKTEEDLISTLNDYIKNDKSGDIKLSSTTVDEVYKEEIPVKIIDSESIEKARESIFKIFK